MIDLIQRNIEKTSMTICSKLKLKTIFSVYLILSFYNLNSFFIRNIPIQNIKPNESLILEEIKSFENKVNLNLSLKLFDDFYLFNSQNKLEEENSIFQKSKSPAITVIMTIYNQAHCLHKCLRSIQNQSIKNIEIIIVDDCSLDNSVDIIRQYKNKDPRIILLEHYSNEGKIKARSDGIRNAKGEYITFIDGDDSFIHKDILNNSLYIAKKADLDVVEFQMGKYKNKKFIRKINDYPELNLTYIVKQPELRTKFIFENKEFPYDLINRSICGKLIKKNLFIKILKYIGVEYTDDFIIFAEDTIMAVSLLHLANSYYLMKELGYYYSFDEKKSNFSIFKNKVCKPTDKIKDFSFFKYLKFLIGKIENNEKEQIMVYKEITTIINYDYYFNDFKLRKEHYEILFYIFNKTLEFVFLTNKQKQNILKLKNHTIENEN